MTWMVAASNLTSIYLNLHIRLISEEKGPPLGSTWLRGFLNRHPELSSKFASGLNRQRTLSSKPGSIKDYFQKLQMLLRKHNFLPHNIYNMDEKAFLLGMSNRAKVIMRRGRGPPQEIENGSREWIIVVETCSANNTMLPLMVVYQVKGLYLDVLMQMTNMQTELHQIEYQSSLARIWHTPF